VTDFRLNSITIDHTPMTTMSQIQLGGMPTQYAVGWFTLALINAGLAQGKGRSGLAWWAVSLFLGPLATLLIVLLHPVKPK